MYILYNLCLQLVYKCFKCRISKQYLNSYRDRYYLLVYYLFYVQRLIFSQTILPLIIRFFRGEFSSGQHLVGYLRDIVAGPSSLKNIFVGSLIYHINISQPSDIFRSIRLLKIRFLTHALRWFKKSFNAFYNTFNKAEAQ